MLIRKYLIIALAVTGFVACNKEDDSYVAVTSDIERQTPYAENVPSTFTQKLLMEMYSTTGCATCPDAELKYRNYAAAHADRVYGVCVHNSDAMDHPQFDVLDNAFNVTAYSSGSFNRLPFNNEVVVHKTSWSNNIVNTCINKTAKCGIKLLTSFNGNTANVTVKTAFNTSISNEVRLTLYIVEDSVSGTGTGYNQANYYNNTVSSPFYQMGNPILGYQHNYVLRKVVTGSFGEIIPQSSIHPRGSFTSNFTIDIAGYDKNQLYIIAFINKKGSTSLTHEILNVQRAKLGSNKDWD